MRFTIIAANKSAHQQEHQAALAEGLSKFGITAHKSIAGSSTNLVSCWGWRHGKILRDMGHEVLVMERGYIGDRFSYSSLAWNGLNGLAKFPDKTGCTSERFDRVGKIRPWKEGGEYVLIMGQVPGDASLRGRNLVPWYEGIAVLAKDFYGLPVKFREHPKSKSRTRPRHTQLCTAGTIQESMDGAAVVVTYNSNSAVDSLLYGVPTIAYDSGSMAWLVANHTIGELINRDREQWAYDLAHKQWTLDEIASGEALKDLLAMKGLA